MILRHNSTVEQVDRAERSGLVRRETDERDLRRSIVQLTAQGRELLDRLVQEHLSELAPRADNLIEALRNLQGTAEAHQ
jgi:DNA-binding MarR family transcriptional regulator